MDGLRVPPVAREIRFSLLRVPLRIQPLFWLSVALLGVRYLSDPEAGSLGYFAFWIVAVLVSIVWHGLAQALMARTFGLSGEVILNWLGSRIVGVELLPRVWQRVLVLAAGPLAQLLLVGIALGMLGILPYPHWLDRASGRETFATCSDIFLRFNLIWGVVTLLPIWPLDGGRLAAILGEALLGKLGWNLALVLSLLTIAALSTGIVMETSAYWALRYDPQLAVHLVEGSTCLVFCFVLWMQTVRALWPEDHGPIKDL